MWLERVSGGDTPLFDLAEAKVHLRILDDDSFDAEIPAQVRAATAFLDMDDTGGSGLRFPLGPQQWDMFQSCFSSKNIYLPFDKVTNIVSVKYHDPDGNLQTLPTSSYHLAGSGRRKFITPVAGMSWPSVGDRPDAVQIRFDAGHASMEAIPEDVIQAGKLLLGHFHENHSAVVIGTVTTKVQMGVDNLIERYRRFVV